MSFVIPSFIRGKVAHSVQWQSYGMDYRGSIAGKFSDFLLFATTSIPNLGPTQPPIQWVLGTPSWSWQLNSIYCRG